MPSAASASSAAPSTRPRAASTMSSRRFTIAARPAHGEKHLRRLETGLVAPGLGPVTKRIERARVRIGPDLALVARHGGDLGLERLGDIHPRVGNEAARDRKSTRLNSSHSQISYAVFCLKKKVNHGLPNVVRLSLPGSS